MGEAAKSGPLSLYQKVASPPTFTPHYGIHSPRTRKEIGPTVHIILNGSHYIFVCNQMLAIWWALLLVVWTAPSDFAFTVPLPQTRAAQ